MHTRGYAPRPFPPAVRYRAQHADGRHGARIDGSGRTGSDELACGGGACGIALRYAAERDYHFGNQAFEDFLSDERNSVGVNGLLTLAAAVPAILAISANPVTWAAAGSLTLMGLGNTIAGFGERLWNHFNHAAEGPKLLTDPTLYWIGGRAAAAGAALPVASPFLGYATYRYFADEHPSPTQPGHSFWGSAQLATSMACFAASGFFAVTGNWPMAASNAFLGAATLSNALTLQFGGVAQSIDAWQATSAQPQQLALAHHPARP